MGGAIFKTYGAEINNVDASKIFSVSIMPCTCKNMNVIEKKWILVDIEM